MYRVLFPVKLYRDLSDFAVGDQVQTNPDEAGEATLKRDQSERQLVFCSCPVRSGPWHDDPS
jgi:hypothetical protein